ncbi:MAG TPA: alkaline phosphatase D family protein [Nocardioides sp.]|nr:alkaline phosphatase D family protein [Nocardioides sp.]
MTDLVVGPLLRYVDDSSASVWVETDGPTTVRVVAGEHEAETPTFAVHGHHYALVCLDGLPAATRAAYRVELDGATVWPPPDSPFPDPMLITLEPGKPLRMAFGSCRTSVTHDSRGNRSHGIDALRAYALRMAGLTDPSREEDPDPGDEVRWPDLVLFLGDQVYADETTDEMREFIESRRDIHEPPGKELKDYQEYAELYRLAWTDPVNRWLLSTLPSAMIFDDHDIRDDWNTSQAWREEMEATDWWHDRIVSGLASYWVYQHLGNLSPAARAQDEIWQRIQAGDDDLGELLDSFADRVDQHPETYRWSYTRDFDTQARLVVVDSRNARVLDPERRSLLDDEEMAWFDSQLVGGFDHLLIGSSLPFLLAAGLHHVEAFSEAMAGRAWGTKFAKVGEKARQTVDLEHWAAFQDAFSRTCAMVGEVARGERGPAPQTVTFLGGDVHHSYVSEAWPRTGMPFRSRVIQAVCSPIRNPLPYVMRFATAFSSYGVAGPIGRLVSRSAKVPDPPWHWKYLGRPWFDNNLATLEVVPGGLHLWWAKGTIEDDEDRPVLVTVHDVTV